MQQNVQSCHFLFQISMLCMAEKYLVCNLQLVLVSVLILLEYPRKNGALISEVLTCTHAHTDNHLQRRMQQQQQ